jgi:hypothetical protein
VELQLPLVLLLTWLTKNQNNMNLMGSTSNPVSLTQAEFSVSRQSAFDKAREMAAEIRKNNPPAAPRKSIFDRTRELAAEIRKNNPPAAPSGQSAFDKARELAAKIRKNTPPAPSASPNALALARNRAEALAKKNLNNNPPAASPSMMPQSAPRVAPQEQANNAGTSVNAGRGVTDQKSNQIPTDPRTESTTKNNKMLLLGAGVLVAGSIIYLMTKKSKK